MCEQHFSINYLCCLHPAGPQVNPDLAEDGKGDGATDSTAAEGANVGPSATRTRRGSAEARPGLMKTTFDEWDTLLVRGNTV